MNWRVVLFAGVVLVAMDRVGRAEVMYKVVDLGTLGGSQTAVSGINDLGQVVGWSRVRPNDLEEHAFRTAPNRPINLATDDLGTFGGTFSYAFGINNLGQVVGESTSADGTHHAFRTAPNQPINPAADDLGGFGGVATAAYAINNLGQVVGWSRLPAAEGGYGRGFRTGPNQPINRLTDDLGTLGGPESFASGINDAGQVVGYSLLSGGSISHAFRTGPNQMINALTDDLGTLGGSNSCGTHLNASGQVAGHSTLASRLGYHVFRTAPNGPINPATDDLGAAGGTYQNWTQLWTVEGMNDRGDMVGTIEFTYGDGDVEKPFVYINSVLYDPNALIDPTSGWTIDYVNGINNLGQIVGTGVHDGVYSAFRMDVVPEPSGLLMAASATGLLALGRRRR